MEHYHIKRDMLQKFGMSSLYCIYVTHSIKNNEENFYVNRFKYIYDQMCFKYLFIDIIFVKITRKLHNFEICSNW